MTIAPRLAPFVLVAAACGSKAPPPAEPLAHRAASDPTTAQPAAPAGEVIVAIEHNVDGRPGDERISYDGVTLRVGALSIGAPLDPDLDETELAPEHLRYETTLRVITLDPARGGYAVLLTTPTAGVEDPPSRRRMFRVTADALEPILDVIEVHDPVAPGDGTLRFQESSWDACARFGSPSAPVPVDDVIYSASSDGKYAPTGRTPSGEQFDCDHLAACPFVYVVDANGEARVIGEVLRYVRGAAAYTLQSLDLPEPTASTLVVRISEEKPEVTYLDEVYVEIGGVRHEPRACATTEPPAYCVADHVPYVLREGQSLDLELDVTATGAAAVFARGYYVPR
jgi:hypothetical protein